MRHESWAVISGVEEKPLPNVELDKNKYFLESTIYEVPYCKFL